MQNIYVGTSGYSFNDWEGNFYPEKMNKNDYFSYYVKHFKTIEINYTYYSLPFYKTFEALDRKSPDDFLFFVKAHSSMTHSRDAKKEDYENFNNALSPIISSHKLSGILFQFPASFAYDQKNIDYLKRIRDHNLKNVAIEFRNLTWINDDVKKELQGLNFTSVCVDEPKDDTLLGKMYLLTSDTLYIRFHSRDLYKWYQGYDKRYDYLYNTDELNEWKEIIKHNIEKFKKAFIFFNNCHAGHAVKNAKQMIDILDI